MGFPPAPPLGGGLGRGIWLLGPPCHCWRRDASSEPGTVFLLGGLGGGGLQDRGPGSGPHSALCGRATRGSVPLSLSLDFVVCEVGQRLLSLGRREGERKSGQTFSLCLGAGSSRSGGAPLDLGLVL